MKIAEVARRIRKGEDWYDSRFSYQDEISRDFLHGLLTGKIPGQVRRKENRWRIQTNLDSSTSVYLKVFEESWLIRRLLKRNPPSSAYQEAESLIWARKKGIHTPEVLGIAKFIGPGRFYQSVLVTRELTGMLPFPEALEIASNRLVGPDFSKWKQRTIGEIAEIAKTLHSQRYCHKDFYLCHFFVDQNLNVGSEGMLPNPLWHLLSGPPATTDSHALRFSVIWTKAPNYGAQALTPRSIRFGQHTSEKPIPVHLIDLTRLKHHHWRWKRWMIKDLAQLFFSSDLPGISVRDRIRFMHRYFNVTKLSKKQRKLIRKIESKTRRYQKKNKPRTRDRGRSRDDQGRDDQGRKGRSRDRVFAGRQGAGGIKGTEYFSMKVGDDRSLEKNRPVRSFFSN